MFPSAKAAGFKLAFSQDSEAMQHILDDANIKKIILYRENVLSVWSSLEIAKRTGVFHVRQSGGSSNKRSKNHEKHRVTIDFNLRRFLKFMNSYEAAYKSVRENLNTRNQAYIEVNYADLFNGIAFPRLEKFLGLSHLFNRDRQHTLKINSANPLDRFTNPEKVQESINIISKTEWLQPELGRPK